MGVCQSTLCNGIDGENPVLGAATPVATKNRVKIDIHPAKDLLSPGDRTAVTNLETPISVHFTPGKNGSLSLESVCMSATSATEHMSSVMTSYDSVEHTASHSRAPTSFPFLSEEQMDSFESDDEESVNQSDVDDDDDEIEAPEPSSSTHCPLVAPPPGQASINSVLQVARKTNSVNDNMIREFNKIKLQATIVHKQEKMEKKDAKIDDRLQDLRAYRSLWMEYKHLKQTAETKKQQQVEEEGGSIHEENETTDDGPTNHFSVKNCNSLNLADSESWYVNFRTKKQLGENVCEDTDDRSVQSSLSLLSEASLEVQRKIFAEKRRAREARYAARKELMELEFETADSDNGKPGTMQIDYEAYFQELMISKANFTPDTTQFMAGDNGPGDSDSITDGSIITDIEAKLSSGLYRNSEVEREGKKPPLPPASARTIQQRWRASRKRGKAETKKIANPQAKENTATTTLRKGADMRSIGNRIAQLEKKIAVQKQQKKPSNKDPPAYSKTSSSNAERRRGSAVSQPRHPATMDPVKDVEQDKENITIVGVAAPVMSSKALGREPFKDISPVVVPPSPEETELDALKCSPKEPAGPSASPEIEPAQLDRLFASPPGVITTSPRTASSTLKEKIVMGNASKCVQNSNQKKAPSTPITFLSTADFLRMSDDNALVRVTRNTANDEFDVQRLVEPDDNDGEQTNYQGELETVVTPDSSPEQVSKDYEYELAVDLEREVDRIIAKFRNGSASADLRVPSPVNASRLEEEVGKLYCA